MLEAHGLVLDVIARVRADLSAADRALVVALAGPLIGPVFTADALVMIDVTAGLAFGISRPVPDGPLVNHESSVLGGAECGACRRHERCDPLNGGRAIQRFV